MLGPHSSMCVSPQGSEFRNQRKSFHSVDGRGCGKRRRWTSPLAQGAKTSLEMQASFAERAREAGLSIFPTVSLWGQAFATGKVENILQNRRDTHHMATSSEEPIWIRVGGPAPCVALQSQLPCCRGLRNPRGLPEPWGLQWGGRGSLSSGLQRAAGSRPSWQDGCLYFRSQKVWDLQKGISGDYNERALVVPARLGCWI